MCEAWVEWNGRCVGYYYYGARAGRESWVRSLDVLDAAVGFEKPACLQTENRSGHLYVRWWR
jgi:hypothetical protein